MKAAILKSALLWVIVLLWTGCSEDESKPNPQIIAHRGISISHPENSQQAFDACVTLGVDALEFDILLTSDDSLLIFHDADVSRLTDLQGELRSFTAAEIRLASMRKTGGVLLTFRQFTERYQGKFTSVYVELKEGQGGSAILFAAALLQKEIRAAGWESITIVTCTSPAPLDTLMQSNSGIRTAIEAAEYGDLFSKAKKYSRVLVNQSLLNTSVYQTVKSAGAQLITFTPNTVAEYQSAISAGCDAIMTDNPIELKKYLISR